MPGSVSPLRYLATGTGAASRLISSKLGDALSVKDFGATGDGSTDDRAAIQAAIDACSTAGGGTVYIPESATPYMVGRSGANAWCLKLKANVCLAGGGPGTVLKQTASIAASVRLLATETADAVTKVVVRDLTLDGNKANQTVDEHRHGAFLQGADDVLFDRVRFQNFTGDGAYLHTGTDRVWFRDCEFANTNRNGLTLGAINTGIRIFGCYFHDIAVQHVDAEPGGTDFSTDVVIDGCVFDRSGGTDYIITMGGTSEANRSRDWKITNNYLTGAIHHIWCDKAVISGNTWRPAAGYTKPCIEVVRRCEGTTITGNTFECVGGSAITATATTGDQPTLLAIVGNIFNLTGDIYAFFSEGGVNDWMFANNVVTFSGTTTTVAAVWERFTFAVQNVSITGNLIKGAPRAINLYSSGTSTAERVTIVGNTIDGNGVVGATAFRIDRSAITELVLSNNNLSADVTFSATFALGTYLIGGNYHAGGAAVYSGTATPEGALTAPIGSMFLRRDGGAGTSMYIKESGVGNTGWVAK